MTYAMLLPILCCLSLIAAPGDVPSASDAASPSANNAHQVAEQILKQPLYRRWELRQLRAKAEPTAPTSWGNWGTSVGEWILDHTQWVSKIWDWLVDLWNSWFGQREGSGSTTSSGGMGTVLYAAGWLLAALIVGLLLFVLYQLWQRSQLQGSQAKILSRRQIHDALQAGEALAMSSSDWLAEVDRWAAQNDLRLVYRSLYLGLLSGLHTQGRIDFRRNRTNWVYVTRFRGPDDHRADFASLTALFDDVWYGGQETDAQNIEPVRQKVRHLLEGGTHA